MVQRIALGYEPDDVYSDARRLEFGERGRERLALGMAVDVDEEHVVPFASCATAATRCASC